MNQPHFRFCGSFESLFSFIFISFLSSFNEARIRAIPKKKIENTNIDKSLCYRGESSKKSRLWEIAADSWPASRKSSVRFFFFTQCKRRKLNGGTQRNTQVATRYGITPGVRELDSKVYHVCEIYHVAERIPLLYLTLLLKTSWENTKFLSGLHWK